MPNEPEFAVQRLTAADDRLFEGILDLFAEAFDDHESYCSARPGDDYRAKLLSRPDFVALAATTGDRVIGALTAYELIKFEQERSEFYIYDLAVAEDWWRRGVTTSLIELVKKIARESGGWVVYVQADYVDEPAIALYTKLGVREDVLHFDLPL